MNNLDTALISVLTPLISALAGLLIWFIKKLKVNSREKEEQQNKLKASTELLNYTMGVVDTILNKDVKLQPNLKKELKIISDRYHSMDLIKEKN